MRPYEDDLNPSPLGQSLLDSRDPRVRVAAPAVRAGFLEKGAGSDRTGRSREPFVTVSWEKALDLVASELRRVIGMYGNEAIYAGSYGWASPGTLHISRASMHRLLNLLGGFTDSIGSYSTAAAEAITPHVIASNGTMVFDNPSWPDIAAHAELVVLFGGATLKNSQVSFGGLGPHLNRHGMRQARANGVQFVNISPIRTDLGPEFAAEWLQPRPNSDTAIMLGLAHTLVSEKLVDRAFIDRYTVGFERFLPYLLGETDGQPKDAAWAAAISELPADTILNLARRMAAQKTLIGVNWAIQRAQHGEQPYWMAVVLAAMLGEIGQPGRGISLGLNAMHAVGSARRPLAFWPKRPKGQNGVGARIPVSRIADMLLNPGAPFDFQRPSLALPRHQAGVLGRGQPVPSSSRSTSANPRLAPAGNDHRQRAVLDCHRAPRRYRPARRHHVGAQRHQLHQAGRHHHPDAPSGRAVRRGPHRLRYFPGSGRALWRGRRVW